MQCEYHSHIQSSFGAENITASLISQLFTSRFSWISTDKFFHWILSGGRKWTFLCSCHNLTKSYIYSTYLNAERVYQWNALSAIYGSTEKIRRDYFNQILLGINMLSILLIPITRFSIKHCKAIQKPHPCTEGNFDRRVNAFENLQCRMVAIILEVGRFVKIPSNGKYLLIADFSLSSWIHHIRRPSWIFSIEVFG